MRGRFTVLGLALAFAMAQPASAQVSLGFRAGASIADISVDDVEEAFDFDSRTGFTLGAFLEMPLTGNVSFQPGLSLTQKGGEQSEAGATAAIEFMYLELPLLLKLELPTASPLGFHGYVGPVLSFETKCEVSLEFDEFDESADCDDGGDPEDNVNTKSFDLGAAIGGGLSLDVGRATLMLDALYNFGLTNVLDEDDGEAKHRAFYITAGIAFPLGG